MTTPSYPCPSPGTRRRDGRPQFLVRAREGATFRAPHYKIDTLVPNKSMGGHLALLDKQYVAHHP